MINNYIKNICLISFALFGPIYLPAGGIQKRLNVYSCFNKSKEIVLTTNSKIYATPTTNSKELRLLKTGTSLLIIRDWINQENDLWFRVQISNSIFVDSSFKPMKGWIKI
tara:strand:+ start:5209 stop:5538 length:330 start_codon:yes stop_codon:yes gene_type:complete